MAYAEAQGHLGDTNIQTDIRGKAARVNKLSSIHKSLFGGFNLYILYI